MSQGTNKWIQKKNQVGREKYKTVYNENES